VLPSMIPPLETPPHVVPTIGDEVPRRAWLRFVALLVLFSMVIVLALVTDLRDHLSTEEIRRVLNEAGLWAPAVLLLAFTIRPLVLFPISPLWIASGAFFGWLEGAAWAILGTALGAAVGFSLARHLGRDFLERRLHARVGRWSRMEPGAGFRTVLALQLTPIMPHDLINSLAAVSRMSYRGFALASLVGTTPIILVYAFIGTTVWEIPSPQFWAAVAVLTVMTATMLLWNRAARLWRSMTRARGGAS
jgi:uncharacterized membrane protein YdjX (TVP38/TMEM64 family)